VEGVSKKVRSIREGLGPWIVDKPDPYAIVLEGRLNTYRHYVKRKKLVGDRFICDVVADTAFAYDDDGRVVWYSSIYGLTSAIDLMTIFLDSKNPDYIVLIGSCGLDREISKKTVVIPRTASQEMQDIRGTADEVMTRTAIQIAERNGLDVVVTDRHVSKFSLVRSLGKASGESEDLEAASVYYMANSYRVPVVGILGVSDYKCDNYIYYVEYEEELKDDVFALASRTLRELKNS